MTDVTNASRTMLMNIHKQQWDSELCEYVPPLSLFLNFLSSVREGLNKTASDYIYAI